MQWAPADGSGLLFPSVLESGKKGTCADAGADDQSSDPSAGGGYAALLASRSGSEL